jgi:hypothetical protein
VNTKFYATKDRLRDVRAGRHHMGGEQHRRKMRAALHDLQKRLGQCRNGLGNVQVVGMAVPAPSAERQIRRNMFQKLHSFYTFFTFCGLL